MTEWEAQQRAGRRARSSAFGRIDVVVANAGFGATRGFQAETPEHWRAMVLTNVYGAALTVRACFDELRARRGHLFLMGSVAGRKVPPGSVYGGHEVGRDGDGRGRAPGAARHRRARHARSRPGRSRRPSTTSRSAASSSRPTTWRGRSMFAAGQPPHVDVNEILIRPTVQAF